MASDMTRVVIPPAPAGQEQDVFVGLNGKGYRIQKGKSVEVPKAVKEILDNAAIADAANNDFLMKEMEKAEKALQK